MSQSTKMILLYGFVLFLNTLEMTLLNVGLPSIAKALQVPLTEIDMVVTAFIWGFTLMIPLAGWLGQRYGDKQIFIWGQVLFTGASIGCF
jgi:MFS family permease